MGSSTIHKIFCPPLGEKSVYAPAFLQDLFALKQLSIFYVYTAQRPQLITFLWLAPQSSDSVYCGEIRHFCTSQCVNVH